MSGLDFALGRMSRWMVRGVDAVSGPGLTILIFHRVLTQPDPLFPAELDAARFNRLMGLVASTFSVLPLSEGVRRLADHSLPHRAMSITFDDGYADNHAVALPILQRHGLPACFFIATGFLDGGRMFNDTVIECVRRSPRERLDLASFGLGEVSIATPQEKAMAIGRVLPAIKYLNPSLRPEALDRFQTLCQPGRLPDDLMMTRAQVRAMRVAGMEIGAHTVHHPILCTLDDAEVEREMVDSRSELQALTGQPVTLFAYPNGRPDQDYGRRHADLAKRLGFAAAVSTAPGVARAGADPFQLPRFTPWDRRTWPWMARLVGNRRHRSFATATAASNRASSSPAPAGP